MVFVEVVEVNRKLHMHFSYDTHIRLLGSSRTRFIQEANLFFNFANLLYMSYAKENICEQFFYISLLHLHSGQLKVPSSGFRLQKY
jgi:hypothetical protein